jgi:O-antigen/teichoic acid export membrane protein
MNEYMNIANRTKNWLYQFLRKTQKYTETDNVYLAKHGSWLFSGQIISALASFLLAIAFANLLDPVVYGNYKYILSLIALSAIFSLTGMRTAITQAAARGLEGSFYTGFKTKFKWGISGSILILTGVIYYSLQGNELLPKPIFLLAIFLPLMYASSVYGSFLIGKKLFNISAKYNVITQIVSAACLIGALVLTKNLFLLILTYLVSHTVLAYFFYLLTKYRYKPNKKEDPKTIPYSKHLSFIGLISAVANHLDKILLFTMIGASQLAVYSFAIVIPAYIKNILQNFNVLALPKFSSGSQQKIKKNILKKIYKLFLLIILIIIAYIISAPYIYKIFFSQYIDSVIYSQLFVFSLIGFPMTLLSVYFQARMMKKQLYLLKITPFIRIILFVILIPIFGIWGAIISILCTEIFNIILTLFLFKKAQY